MTATFLRLPSRVSEGEASTASVVPAHKRVMDIALIICALPILLPVFVLIAVAVKLSSAGPVMFVQTRVGRDGKAFRMVKFRSMYRDAEARRQALLATSEREGICFKQKHDPRITGVGRLLRLSSLDELPQLWNVLRGDMSLVGPRPALPEEVAQYAPQQMARLRGLPGLTGLWQVSGRADIGFEDMVALDLEYLQNASFGRDLHILLRTVRAVITARGAY